MTDKFEWRFWREETATSSAEFALIAPILIILLLGGVELNNKSLATRRINQVAYSIAQIISETPMPPGTVNYQDLRMASDSAMLAFPLVLSTSFNKSTSWNKVISITISSIMMIPPATGCTSNCTYVGYTTWSWVNDTGAWAANKRPCKTKIVPSASDTATPTSSTLPPDAFVAGSTIVVDISYNYTPSFLSNIFGSTTFVQSYYLQPRNIQPSTYLKYVTLTDDPGQTTVCPGY